MPTTDVTYRLYCRDFTNKGKAKTFKVNKEMEHKTES